MIISCKIATTSKINQNNNDKVKFKLYGSKDTGIQLNN